MERFSVINGQTLKLEKKNTLLLKIYVTLFKYILMCNENWETALTSSYALFNDKFENITLLLLRVKDFLLLTVKPWNWRKKWPILKINVTLFKYMLMWNENW